MKTQLTKASDLMGKTIKKMLTSSYYERNTEHCLLSFTDGTFFLLSAYIRDAHEMRTAISLESPIRLEMFSDADLIAVGLVSEAEMREWRQEEEHKAKVYQEKEDRRMYELLKQRLKIND